MAVRDLGIVTAYGYAKAGGYTGTEQEFTALLGDLALTVEDLENMTVSVTTLESDQQATASYADGVLSLGIPRGRNGEVTQDDLDAQLENYATNEDLYGAYIVKSASGAIASFADGADDVPMKSLNVTITPKQSGSGDPSPDNVRPITGWTEANVTVAGVNLWDEEWENGVIDSATGGNTASSSYIRSKNYLPCSPQATYFFYCGGANYGTFNRIAYYDKAKNYLGSSAGFKVLTKNATFTTPAGAYYMRFFVQSSTYTSDISINYPATDTEYHAYNGHTTPVPLGQTVYGGEDEAVSGTLTTTHKMDVFDGSDDENWSWQSSGRARLEISGIKPSSGRKEVMCNIGVFSATAEDPFTIFQSGAYIYYYPPTSVTSLEAFKTWLASNNMQIRYELNTPIVTTHTPVSVTSLLGTNNVWADCGAVEVEYRADPTLAYAELQALILENL